MITTTNITPDQLHAISFLTNKYYFNVFYLQKSKHWHCTLNGCYRNGTKTEKIQQTANMKIFAPYLPPSLPDYCFPSGGSCAARSVLCGCRNILTSCQAQITASGPRAPVTNGILCHRDIAVVPYTIY